MKSKKIFLGFLAILFLIIIGVSFRSGMRTVAPITSTTSVDTSLWKTFTATTSGFSFIAPAQSIESPAYGNTDLVLRIDSAYYRTLGITGTTSVSLQIMTGVGTDQCDTTSFSGRGDSASSTIVTISGEPFYDVKSSDEGMSQFIEDDRYVELLAKNSHTDGSCRFIDFRLDTAQPGVYTDNPAEIQAILDNNARTHIEAVEQAIFKSVTR